MPRPLRRLLPLLVVPILVAASCPEPGVHVLALLPDPDARVWEKVETVGYVWPEVANPFDPAQVDVVTEWRAPDGRVLRVPAFVTRDYTRALVAGRERLTPRGRTLWKARFLPDVPGTWQWRWTVAQPAGGATSPWRTLEVAPASPDRHGLLRPSPDDARYLRFDDGTPYFAVGENLAWYDARGTHAYDDWLAKLAAQGATWVRLWMPSWAFGLEWIRRGPGGVVASSSLGDYTERLDRAWQLDQVLDAAERHGIQVMLCLQNHGAFSLEHNSEWADNPYNAANGGPLVHAREFFTDSAARALFRRRLRYVVARWGAHPNVMAWELWNEVDLAEQPAHADLLAWHEEMAAELRALDPHRRMVATSTAFAVPQPLWDLPALDLGNMHFYSYIAGFAAPIGFDFPTWLPTLVARRPAGKPTLLAEFGVDARGPAETQQLDPHAIGFHDGLWAPLFGGAYGTGMSWWWDNVVDPEGLYPHIGGVAAFVRGVAFDREGFVAGGAGATAPGRTLRALALRGRTTVLAWIKNAAHQWWPVGTGADFSVVEGATVTLDGVADGAWRARFFHTVTGEEIAAALVTAVADRVTLAVPDFVGDVALRMERVDVDGP